MIISINNAIQATLIFEAILLIALLFSMRKKKDNQFFPVSQSQELKGLAILLIVFSHIGYFLVANHAFLYPISTLAGVGVDLFLFLSGLGLTASALKKKLPILDFYKKNLIKLYTPFWVVLVSFLLLDFFILGIDYPWEFVTKALFGVFTSADLYKDINSPMWYFTFIIFYYIAFPILFYKKKPWLSAIAIYIVSYIILRLNIPAISGVSYFYNLHIMAFPLGMIGAWLFYELPNQNNKYYLKIKDVSDWFRKNLSSVGHYGLITLLITFICGFSYYFGGQSDPSKVQLVSIITVLAIIWLFTIKKVEFKLLYLFGIYSYEIYLLHWPIMYRYDFIYKYTPAWLATALYLIFFIGLSWLLKKVVELILKTKKS